MGICIRNLLKDFRFYIKLIFASSPFDTTNVAICLVV